MTLFRNDAAKPLRLKKNDVVKCNMLNSIFVTYSTELIEYAKSFVVCSCHSFNFFFFIVIFLAAVYRVISVGAFILTGGHFPYLIKK